MHMKQKAQYIYYSNSCFDFHNTRTITIDNLIYIYMLLQDDGNA